MFILIVFMCVLAGLTIAPAVTKGADALTWLLVNNAATQHKTKQSKAKR